MESRRRSIVKALTWRVVATLITASVVWGVTGEIAFAAAIGLIDTTTKLGIYYAHERLWIRIPFGRMGDPEYRI